jgi:hypothetical protein
MDEFLKWLKEYKKTEHDKLMVLGEIIFEETIDDIINMYKIFKAKNQNYKEIAAAEISQNNENTYKIKIDNIENGLSIPTFSGSIDIRFIFTDEYNKILLENEIIRLKNEYGDLAKKYIKD